MSLSLQGPSLSTEPAIGGAASSSPAGPSSGAAPSGIPAARATSGRDSSSAKPSAPPQARPLAPTAPSEGLLPRAVNRLPEARPVAESWPRTKGVGAGSVAPPPAAAAALPTRVAGAALAPTAATPPLPGALAFATPQHSGSAAAGAVDARATGAAPGPAAAAAAAPDTLAFGALPGGGEAEGAVERALRGLSEDGESAELMALLMAGEDSSCAAQDWPVQGFAPLGGRPATAGVLPAAAFGSFAAIPQPAFAPPVQPPPLTGPVALPAQFAPPAAAPLAAAGVAAAAAAGFAGPAGHQPEATSERMREQFMCPVTQVCKDIYTAY